VKQSPNGSGRRTHYGGIVFLGGTSIYLQSLRKPWPQLARFLVSRGLWLMVLEVVVVSSMLTFHPSTHFFMLQVIWVTGLSMIVMAALIYLPLWAVASFGAVLVLVHNTFDSIKVGAHRCVIQRVKNMMPVAVAGSVGLPP
jgi:uncharacterized membrane protein